MCASRLPLAHAFGMIWGMYDIYGGSGMVMTSSSFARARQWRAALQKCRPEDRGKLLATLVRDISSSIPLAANASRQEWDVNACLEIAPALSVIIGAWMDAEPVNPEWPCRDRLFLTRRNDVLTAGSALAFMGFFEPDTLVQKIDAPVGAPGASIPGLEPFRPTPTETVTAAWLSAVDSTRSKRYWFEAFATAEETPWADREWEEFGGVWKTCILLDHTAGEALETLRTMPEKQDAQNINGLVALVAIPKTAGVTEFMERWRSAGWDAQTVTASDSAYLCEILKPYESMPRVVALTTDPGQSMAAGQQSTGETSQLLGELSDDQFNALMDISVQI